MRNAQRFNFTEGFDGFGVPDALPQLPISLTYQDRSVEFSALLDTGASVNVLPYSAGVQLGAIWEEQTTSVILAGNLASIEARGLLVSAQIGNFNPVRLVFAWSLSDDAPLLLGVKKTKSTIRTPRSNFILKLVFLSWLILLARTAETPIFRYNRNSAVLLAQSMLTLKTSKLTLADVQRHLHFQEKLEDVSFTELLTLETVSEAEKLELVQIRNDFRPYLMEDKASEGQVKVLTLFPLLRLAGFYRYPIKIRVEEGIDNIILVDEDKTISGRFDIVTVNNSISTVNNIPFWILVIEAKESGIEVRQGLPQLLTYAYNSLERQPSVWGLATNGLQYMFVYLRQETNPTYQIMPELNLMYPESAINLLQILKAMGQLILET